MAVIELDLLKAAVRRHAEVRLSYLFGSRASGRAASDSDWDVAVLFDRDSMPELRLVLADALHQETGLRVEIVALNRAPVELASRVVCEGLLLHARSVEERVEYESTVLARAWDAAPVLNLQRREILEGAGHERAVERYRAALGKTLGGLQS